MRSLNRSCWLVLLTLLIGCNSRGLVEVSGTVTVDGKPTAGVMLMFFSSEPNGVTASGVSDEQGKFILTSGLDKGLVAGNYTVTATYPDPSVKPTAAQMMQGTYEPGPDLLKGKYINKANSTIKVEIKSGMKELAPIELKKG